MTKLEERCRHLVLGLSDIPSYVPQKTIYSPSFYGLGCSHLSTDGRHVSSMSLINPSTPTARAPHDHTPSTASPLPPIVSVPQLTYPSPRPQSTPYHPRTHCKAAR